MPNLYDDRPQSRIQRYQAQLPLSLAGLALGNSELTRSSAYVSSFHGAVAIAASNSIAKTPASGATQALEYLKAAFHTPPPTHDASEDQPQSIRQIITNLTELITDRIPTSKQFGVNITEQQLQDLPSPVWNAFLLAARDKQRKQQHTITNLLNATVFAVEIRGPANPQQAARLVSLCQRGASAAHAAIPSMTKLIIPDPAMILNIRSRLGDDTLRQEQLAIAARCGCGNHHDAEHTNNCPFNGAMHFRHNVLAYAIVDCINTYALCPTTYDAKPDAAWSEEGGIRPDIIATGFADGGGDSVIEVTISNPACDTFAHRASLSALTAAKARTISKTGKYAEFAQRNDYELLIAAAEVPGAFGPELNKIIARTAYLFNTRGLVLGDATTWAAPNVGTLMSQRLAVAIINGNYAAHKRHAGANRDANRD